MGEHTELERGFLYCLDIIKKYNNLDNNESVLYRLFDDHNRVTELINRKVSFSIKEETQIFNEAIVILVLINPINITSQNTGYAPHLKRCLNL